MQVLLTHVILELANVRRPGNGSGSRRLVQALQLVELAGADAVLVDLVDLAAAVPQVGAVHVLDVAGGPPGFLLVQPINGRRTGARAGWRSGCSLIPCVADVLATPQLSPTRTLCLVLNTAICRPSNSRERSLRWVKN